MQLIQASAGSNGIPSTSTPAEVIATWKNAQAVCFDVDSTVCEDEGIDELADYCGAGEAVAEWTARAMGGAVPFEDALAARLDLFRPSVRTLAKFLDTRPPRLSKGIRELVAKLHSRGTAVYLVSGGFRQMIAPVAAQLQIPSGNVFANTLLFGDLGEFTGFDATEPTSRSGGKALAIDKIKKEHGYQTLVMIGDGATDLEARRPGGADLFICYGGVVARPAVVAGADWFVTSFKDLIESLD
jgi:phosphoserine phosphatase